MNWVASLMNIKKRVYSQADQDGIIEAVFLNIGTTNKFCVEFGFDCNELTGGYGSNTARLVLQENWKALLMDGGHENPAINLHKEFLLPDNLGDVFRKYEVPMQPDYVSIDVDSIDLWLFRAMLLEGYRPRLIGIEYNCWIQFGISATVKLGTTWVDNDAVFGASLTAMHKVAREFGYSLICIGMYQGNYPFDLFFIRDDLVPPSFVPPVSEFAKYTGFTGNRFPSEERFNLFVEYREGMNCV